MELNVNFRAFVAGTLECKNSRVCGFQTIPTKTVYEIQLNKNKSDNI